MSMSSNPVLEFVEQHAEAIAATGVSNEKLGKLDADSARLLRESGVIRMLAPRQYGGGETHPAEFAETVIRLASLDGSTGWVAGIVGVHPWELARFWHTFRGAGVARVANETSRFGVIMVDM